MTGVLFTVDFFVVVVFFTGIDFVDAAAAAAAAGSGLRPRFFFSSATTSVVVTVSFGGSGVSVVSVGCRRAS